MGTYGTIWKPYGPIRDPYGPILAHTGPYRTHMGPYVPILSTQYAPCDLRGDGLVTTWNVEKEMD